MKKLELELVKIFDTKLGIKIVHQDDSIRRKNSCDDQVILYNRDGLSVKSIDNFDCNSTILYLHGLDDITISERISTFKTKKDRDDFYDFLIEAQIEINKPKKIKKTFWFASYRLNNKHIRYTSSLYDSRDDVCNIEFSYQDPQIHSIEIEVEE